MTLSVLLAARGGEADPFVFFIGFLFCVVLFIAMLLLAAKEQQARLHVVSKSSVPYCPRCNRQVSLRRGECRSCGHVYISYGPSPGELALREARKAQAATELERTIEERNRLEEQRRSERADSKARRREERNEYYLDRGIKPGPFAWWQLMPDWLQAIMIGLVVAKPATIVLASLLLSVS
jgi:hypothetical protein